MANNGFQSELENMIDDIVDWVSFVNTLNYIGGNFYLSNYANQDWHHDKKYCKLRRKILKFYKNNSCKIFGKLQTLYIRLKSKKQSKSLLRR